MTLISAGELAKRCQDEGRDITSRTIRRMVDRGDLIPAAITLDGHREIYGFEPRVRVPELRPRGRKPAGTA